ncbi:hypothetical protein QFZ42_000396 [Variovorax paradoxus]|jgi:hypothetical protein|uniref:hypothetical protein n=1 Tax=Variovorax paradoxus TaxID=34073 RepID=UPI00278F02D6|nr:hypothetical protein [Variovorax paradoxus]MDQ0568562.1 hypothetical protein [Variovorax paradoxus]
MSAVWHAPAEAPENDMLMLLAQRLMGFLLFFGLMAGALLAASGGCAAVDEGAGNSGHSTLAPIMATDSRTARPPRPKCAASQAGRSSKAKPTP